MKRTLSERERLNQQPSISQPRQHEPKPTPSPNQSSTLPSALQPPLPAPAQLPSSPKRPKTQNFPPPKSIEMAAAYAMLKGWLTIWDINPDEELDEAAREAEEGFVRELERERAGAYGGWGAGRRTPTPAPTTAPAPAPTATPTPASLRHDDDGDGDGDSDKETGSDDDIDSTPQGDNAVLLTVLSTVIGMMGREKDLKDEYRGFVRKCHEMIPGFAPELGKPELVNQYLLCMRLHDLLVEGARMMGLERLEGMWEDAREKIWGGEEVARKRGLI